eukprot:2102411-Rhodomonas_salina.2
MEREENHRASPLSRSLQAEKLRQSDESRVGLVLSGVGEDSVELDASAHEVIMAGGIGRTNGLEWCQAFASDAWKAGHL